MITPCFVDLSPHFGRELCSVSDVKSFFVQSHFHQSLNLNVIFHFVQLAKDFLATFACHILGQIKNGVFFDFHLEDPSVLVIPEQSDVIYKILNEQFGTFLGCVALGHCFNFNYVVVEESKFFFCTV